MGTWLQNIAASILMYSLTGSPLMVGLLNFAGFLPILLFSLFGGVISDRFDRRRVIVVTHSISMVAVLSVALMILAGLVTPLLLIATAAITNTSYAMAKPSLTSLLPSLVPRERLAEATGLNLLQFTGGQLGGSILAAVVVASVGAGWAYLLNAITFLGPIVALLLIRNVPKPDPATRKRSGLSLISEGLVYVRSQPILLWCLGGIAATSALAEGLRTLSPVLASEAFGQPEGAAGLLVAAWGIGSAISIVAVGPLSRRWSAWRLAAVGGGLHGLSAIAVALAPSFASGLGAAFALGLGYSLAFTVLTARLQDEAADALRGRVMSLHTLSHLGMRPFNALIAGALATTVGPHVAFAVLALLGPAALVAAIMASRSRRSDGPAVEPLAG